MKKFVTALICMTLLLLFAIVGIGQAASGTAIPLYLDGKLLQTDIPPRLVGNTTMVPLRVVSEELGAKVLWDQTAKRVTVEKDRLVLQLYADKTEAFVNGKSKKLETAPLVVEGTTLVPVRFVTENLGLKVNWDNLTRSVFLTTLENAIAVSGNLFNQENTLVLAGATPTSGPSSSPTPSASPTPSPSAGAAPSQPSPSASPGADNAKSNLPAINKIALNGDTLKIAAVGGSIKPRVIRMSNPERLVIEVPDAVLGKTINDGPVVQNGEISVNHSYISKIRYALYQDNSSTVRIVIDLKQHIEYKLLQSKDSGEWTLSFGKSRYRVVIDAGHGGTAPGTTSASGRKEKDFNLALVLKLAKILEADPKISVYLTRQDDTFVEREDRAKLANDLKADLFISIHGNSFTGNRSVSGTETHYTREESKKLAEILHRHILAAAAFKDRNVRKSDFQVTRETVMPAVLCEIGFLSNPQEEQTMWNEQFQLGLAEAIADGIKEYLKIP